MDSESEFPVPSREESELIKEYFQTESQFVAAKGYFVKFQQICLRKRIVSLIDTVWRSISSDAYIPYLAMNYFDRIISRFNEILTDSALEGRNDSEKLRLIAICCLIIAAKIRINNFSVDQLLRDLNDMKVVITHQMVRKAEYLILDQLNWKMLPVTAFCFLNHYYPYFKEFGGFKRRCINEIIIQAQGEHSFVENTPSQIALSAFLAASKIAYPSKYDKMLNPSNFHKIDNEEEVKNCLNPMIKLCSKLDIHIEPAESGIGSSCSKVVNSCEEKEKEDGTTVINGVGTSSVKEIQQGSGKAWVVGSSEEKEKEDGTAIINGVATSTVKEILHGNGNGKVAVVCSREEKNKEDGTAVINWVGNSTVKEIQHGNSNDMVAVVVGSCLYKELENGTVIINGDGTSKVKEIQQASGKAGVVGSSEEKEKDGTAIIKEVGTSKVVEIQHSKSKDIVVNFCEEENEDEEVGTALVQRRQVRRNTDPSQVQVEVIQLPIDDKDRVEAIIRRSLEKCNAIEAEEPQLQMGGSSSQIVDLVEPMNFELKWMAGATSTSAIPY
ncbi:unnamed protein product [Vicia faba]|uniref:B-like cyclin n=1 Tax=Vicia faba TaxID=3906 RepID=A0AAV0Z8G2_VICFA|nr:unnamed protein product [Vicia faba]